MKLQSLDLTSCDREPIHIPGAVQAHGVLVVVGEPDLTIRQISANSAAHFGASPESLRGQSLSTLLNADDLRHLQEKVLPQMVDANPLYLPAMTIGERTFEPIAHRLNGNLVLEFELQTEEARDYSSGTYSQLRGRLNDLNQTASVKEFCARAADAVRDFTGFDRVMVYRFLEDGAGQVIAEARRDDLESFLGLHYPASDIPQQARRLYLLNPIRVLVDVDSERASLLNFSGEETPLDMSYSALRAMSPIHLEYLRNMGVRASMSISIIKDGALWGLFACHHHTPHYVPHAARMATEFLAHLLSLQIAAKVASEQFEYSMQLKNTRDALIGNANENTDLDAALVGESVNLLTTLDADGAAFVFDDAIKTVGVVPSENRIAELVEWLRDNYDEEVFATHRVSSLCAPLENEEHARGILAARLTRHKPEYLLWFRGEYAHQIAWAGDPTKPVTVGEFGARLTPRKSFGAWQESVAGQAKSWLECEVEHAASLRRSLVDVVLRRAEELRLLNEELERSNVELDSFAYVASHDLKEPLRGIHNYSHFLLEDYGDQLDEAGKEQLRAMTRMTERMENLLDTLLHYSQLGRTDLNLSEVDLQAVLDDSLLMLQTRIEESGAQIRVPRALPVVRADAGRIGEIFDNLIVNALKYNDKDEKWIEIAWRENAGQPPIFSVRDNGIGIDAKHHDNIFRIFKRLHARDQFGGGVGAGLTIVKKIVERHGGKIWIESELRVGTTVSFTLSESTTP